MKVNSLAKTHQVKTQGYADTTSGLDGAMLLDTSHLSGGTAPAFSDLQAAQVCL